MGQNNKTMKTKLFTLFLALAASVGTMFAYDLSVEGVCYNLNKNNKTATVTYQSRTDAYGTNANKDRHITSANILDSVSYNGQKYCVKTIGDDAFNNCRSLTTVNIPKTVTTVNLRAFRNCGITSVTIPNSVTSIGNSAFKGCISLTSVTIPNSVTSIGSEAFAECYSLTSVTIPNSVKSIGYDAFESVPNIIYSGSASGSPWGAKYVNGYVEGYLVYADATKTKLLACSPVAIDVSIPVTVQIIGDSAFYGCSNLTSITIPDNVTSIGNYAFWDCSSLTSVTIGKGVTSIGNYAFWGCSSLTSVTIGKGVTSIDRAFDENTVKEIWFTGTLNEWLNVSWYPDQISYSYKLYIDGSLQTNIIIPNSITGITAGAFKGCNSLISVTIPNSVTYIGELAFYKCCGLTSITIPQNVTTIGEAAFYNCTQLQSLIWNARKCDFSISENGYHPFGGTYGEYGYIKSITIGESVESLPANLFNEKAYEFKGLDSIIWNATNFKDVEYSPFYERSSQISSIQFGNKVKHIPAFLCYGMRIYSITIPDNVISIGAWAFYNSGLSSVTIPKNVASIGNAAFSCYEITMLSDQPCSIDSEPFTYDLGRIYVPCGSLETYQQAWPNYKLYIKYPPQHMIQAGSCEHGKVQVPQTICENEVTAIADAGYHFEQWSDGNTDNPRVVPMEESEYTATFALDTAGQCGDNLTWLLADGTLIVSGSGDMWELDNTHVFWTLLKSSITKVSLPSEMTSISDKAFSGCNITEIHFTGDMEDWCNKLWTPSSISTSYTLYIQEEKVTNVVVPNGVLSIAGGFAGCNNLASIIVPNSVKYVGAGFAWCNNLVSATIGNGVVDLGVMTFYECSNLETVSLGSAVETIGTAAFSGCQRLIDIYCYAERVPTVDASAFDGVSRKAYVWVPANRLRNYQTHEIWGEFDVKAMAAEDANASSVTIVPDYNTASVIWPAVDDADTYELAITDKDGKTICTLVFNGDGILQSIAFGAPSRNNAPEHTQSTGFRFEVSGLEEGTSYNYSIVAKDVTSKALQTFNGSFKTLGGVDALNNISTDKTSLRKEMINGQLFILRGDKTYTVQGQEVR